MEIDDFTHGMNVLEKKIEFIQKKYNMSSHEATLHYWDISADKNYSRMLKAVIETEGKYFLKGLAIGLIGLEKTRCKGQLLARRIKTPIKNTLKPIIQPVAQSIDNYFKNRAMDKKKEKAYVSLINEGYKREDIRWDEKREEAIPSIDLSKYCCYIVSNSSKK